MQKQEVEARVLEACEAVLVARQVEDDRVELKAQWPDPGRSVARQIAGHANAAGGFPILWIIGADERRKAITSPQGIEPADWWAQTVRWFAGLAPDLVLTLVVPFRGQRVLALMFETDRAPYLVKTEGAGGVDREVPWRTANSTRSAHREELLRTVLSQVRVPQAEVLNAKLTLSKWDPDGTYNRTGPDPEEPYVLRYRLDLFVSAAGPCHLPEHRQTLTVIGQASGSIGLDGMTIAGPRGAKIHSSQAGISYGDLLNSVVVSGNSGLQVNSSDQLTMHGEINPDDETVQAILRDSELTLKLRMGVDRTSTFMEARCALKRLSDDLTALTQPWDAYTLLAEFGG